MDIIKDIMKINNYNDARKLINPKYGDDFNIFVETGEASQEFLDYLDKNEQAQEAVDWYLRKEKGNVDNFMKELYNQGGFSK